MAMTQEELMELLQAHEWRDVEFKEARHGVPRRAYETVCAFANTEGGHLVFGVKRDGDQVEIVGVLDVDKVQNEFISTVRQTKKLSVDLDIREELHSQSGADLLLFTVSEARREAKPVFLDGNISRAFVRRGGSNVHCSENERDRFLRDAATDRYDGQALDFALDTAFDEDSLHWYRARHEERRARRSHAELSDRDFLAEMGLLVETKGHLLPTRAAILLFGSNRTFRQLMPRMVVDCQRFSAPRAEADTGERWFDRMELHENIVCVWRSLVGEWYPKIAERPFRVDPSTLRRDDTPPDYPAFREAMVNLLLHQDYADHTRTPVIKSYPDQTVFWNPGDAFATDADLLEPGYREARNPRLVLAFRQLGISENAGWGLRDIYRNWRELGNVPPTVRNDKPRKAFEVVLKKEALLTEEQVAFQRNLGVALTEDQAGAFAFLCRARSATPAELQAVTGQTATATERITDVLATQALIRQLADSGTFRLAEHIEAALDEATANHGDPEPAAIDASGLLGQLDQTQLHLLQVCDVPRSVTELADEIGLPRSRLRERCIEPLVQRGILRATKPDKPRSRDQRYVLTRDGVALKAARIAIEGDKRDAG